MSDFRQEPGAAPEPAEELTTMSYMAVKFGLPVVTHSGEQFGFVVHVLQVPEEDLFDGIVVYVGTDPGVLIAKHPRLAHFDMLRVGQLEGKVRFVDADQVAAITPSYVKCTFEKFQVFDLPAPDGPPVRHADMVEEEFVASHRWFGRWFTRPHWSR